MLTHNEVSAKTHNEVLAMTHNEVSAKTHNEVSANRMDHLVGLYFIKFNYD